MKITFKNLGAIDDGSIELKPLTVLCGSSNTGKTFAMYTLYGLMGLFSFDKINFLKVYLEQLQSTGTTEIDLNEVLKAHWHEIEKKVSSSLQSKLSFFFSADAEVFKDSQIITSANMGNALAEFRKTSIDFSTTSSKGKVLLQITKAAESLTVSVSLTGTLPIEIVESNISQVIGQAVLSPWGGKVFLLPAERAGLNLFYKELNRQRTALLHHASKPVVDFGALFRDMIARYPQPIADYIDVLNDLTNLKRKKGVHHELALSFQKDVLGIKKYQIDKEGNITFVPKKSDKVLSLHLGSSNVKSLFGMWFYLEHVSVQGDYLMIDEPELNLHPEHQRFMACAIARLVNRGTKVMVTTHSDYFVRQINSLIMLGNAGEKGLELAKKYKYDVDSLLKCDQVSAYLFDSKTIKPMEVDPAEGIIAETFDYVIRDLNNDSNAIFSELND